MTTRGQSWWLVGILALGVGVALGWQALETSRLRAETVAGHAAAKEASQKREIAHVPPATSADAAKLASLRADRAALERLRTEIETLKKAAAAADLDKGSQKPDQSKSKPLASSDWKHAGRATPESAIETFLWAGLNRNVDVLTSSLVIEPGAAQEKARNLLSSLPEQDRSYYGSPERYLAHLTAGQLDYDSLLLQQSLPMSDEVIRQVRQHQPEVSDVTLVVVDLQMEEGTSKRKTLLMQRSFDGWKFLVPESAVDAYSEQIANGATAKR